MVCTPHGAAPQEGAFYPPTVVGTDSASEEIVQEETFGPVVVIQRASDFAHALELCNCTPHGLVAALFSSSSELEQEFLDKARAGVLKVNLSTAGAGIGVPFGGWKASGVGPPEHGASNLEFYTRAQSVYLR
jgi:acyl-CoA reductase-like NAD-dependent aldehyde dehydrogenase